MPRDARCLVVDIDVAPKIRSAVGPTAWFVLECVAEQGPAGVLSFEMETNTRQLGAELGLSKDAVARALRALSAAEVIVRSDFRDPRSGRFERSIYFVDLGEAGLHIEAVPANLDTAARRALPDQARPPGRDLDDVQLSFAD